AFTNYHVVIIRDGQQRGPVRKNRVECFTNLPYLEGNGVRGHSEVKVPIEVEIIIEVMPHERLVGELLVHEFVEEGDGLRAIHWLVKVRRHPREVNPLAEIIGATLLEALQKDRKALFRRRAPVPGNES